MRRLLYAGCIGTIAVAMLGGLSSTARAQVQPGKQVEVSVDIRCLPGNEVSIYLKPWNVPVALGDSIVWKLNIDAGVPDITITPKDKNKWAYDDPPPYKGNAANGPKAKKMKASAKVGDRYSYNVSAVCTRADGTTSNIIIDPDMIIIGKQGGS